MGFVDATLVRLPAMVLVSMNYLRIGCGTLGGLDYVCTVVGGRETLERETEVRRDHVPVSGAAAFLEFE